jgi:hypothetical protein
MDLLIFLILLCAIVLTIVGVLYLFWRGLIRPVYSYLVEKEIFQPIVPTSNTTHRQMISERRRCFIWSGILSAVLALAETKILRMNTPGWWVMDRLAATANEKGEPYDLRIIVLLPIVLDACIIFVFVWMACSIWIESRHQK